MRVKGARAAFQYSARRFIPARVGVGWSCRGPVSRTVVYPCARRGGRFRAASFLPLVGLSPCALRNVVRSWTASGLFRSFPTSEAWQRRLRPFPSGGRPEPPLVGRMPFFVSDFVSGPGLFPGRFSGEGVFVRIYLLDAFRNRRYHVGKQVVGRRKARPTDISFDSAGTMVGGVVLDEASVCAWSLKVFLPGFLKPGAFLLPGVPRPSFLSAGGNKGAVCMMRFLTEGYPSAPVGLACT